MRVVVGALLLALLAQPAWGGKPPTAGTASAVVEQARKLTAEGNVALDAHDLPRALLVLEQAYRLSPTPDLLYPLGRVARAQGRTAAAADLFSRYLVAAGDEVDPQIKTDIEQFLDTPREPGTEVTVAGDEAALLLVDDRIAGVLPLTLPMLLPAGSHRFVLEQQSHRVETEVTLPARRRAVIRFTLVPEYSLLTLTPAVMLVQESSGLPVDLATQVSQAVSEAVSKERAVLISRETQAALLLRTPDLGTCLGTVECQEKLAQQADAQFVLALRLQVKDPSAADAGNPNQRQGRKSFHFTAKLLDVEAGATGESVEEDCAACSMQQAMQSLGELTRKLVQKGTTQARGTLRIASVPAGAAVKIDGRKLGVTPYQREALVGFHEVVVERAGYLPYRSAVTVEEGQTVPLELPLQQAVPPQPPRRQTVPLLPPRRQPLQWVRLPRPKWRLITGGIALGVGAVVTGFGISGLATNGIPCMADCPQSNYVYHTLPIGGGLTGAGAALALAGAGLIAWPGGRRKLQAAPAGLSGGVGVQVAGDF